MTIITALYVPGDRQDRFDKAVTSGANMVIFDLEDAVAPRAKDRAREAVAQYLRWRTQDVTVQVRVNAADTPAGRADLEMVASLPESVEIRVPKVEHPAELDVVADAVGTRCITALLESPQGVLETAAIARHPQVTRLALGESDLSSIFGIRSEVLLDFARAQVVFAARAAALDAPMLSAYPHIADLDGLRADTLRGKAMGWVGRVAIHPRQLPVIAAAFAPSATDLEWATQVLQIPADGGVATLQDGQMIDPAMRGRAEAIVRSAAENHQGE
jgi:citrate lyase subunit beta/citryl-CoA lyase